MDTTHSFTICIKNKVEELERVHTEHTRFLERLKMPFKVINTIDIALDEILTNIISYGFKDLKVHEIFIKTRLHPHKLVTLVMDDGIPFNPTLKNKPDLSTGITERPIGGLGLHLVKEMSDKLIYHYKKGKNILKIEINVGEKTDGN